MGHPGSTVDIASIPDALGLINLGNASGFQWNPNHNFMQDGIPDLHHPRHIWKVNLQQRRCLKAEIACYVTTTSRGHPVTTIVPRTIDASSILGLQPPLIAEPKRSPDCSTTALHVAQCNAIPGIACESSSHHSGPLARKAQLPRKRQDRQWSLVDNHAASRLDITQTRRDSTDNALQYKTLSEAVYEQPQQRPTKTCRHRK